MKYLLSILMLLSVVGSACAQGFVRTPWVTNSDPAVARGALAVPSVTELNMASNVVRAAIENVQTNQNVFNILDYGALTNSHKALQICLDKAGTNNGGGGVCFIPAGDWYITNSSFYPTLSSENLESMLVIIGTNTIVRGVGPASKIIVDLGVLASRNVFGSGDSVASGGGRVNWAGTKNATFMHFTLDSQLNGGDQTQMYGGHTFNFLNVRSLNSGADFIDTESLTTTAIGCYVSNAIGSAFQTKPATSETAHGIIADCWFEDSSSAATAPTIQVLNNVAILCSNTKIGGSKNIYTMGSFAGGQFSFDNCYFYPTNGGQAPMIIVNAVGGFTDCIFYGTGSTTASNYVYATNSNLQFANSTFYSKDGLLGHDVKALVMGNRFVNGATAAITLRGTSSSPWGSLITGNTFAGGSAAALDSSVSFLRFDGNTTTDRNVLITGGTNSIIANNTMIGTASTRISSASLNEIRDNIMPVNSASVHSIMLTSTTSNTISGNRLGKFTFNTGNTGNELKDNKIESFAYIGGATAANTLNTGFRKGNMTWTNTAWEIAEPFTFNVKAFGAKGDGTTLDELAVQAAIDAASTNGGTVWFPNGIYRIGTNNPLTSYTPESYPCYLTLRSNNVVLEGESRERSIIVAGTNAPASWNFLGSGGVGLGGVTNCAIKNLTLDGASFQNVVDLTQIYYPDNFLFENVIFKNMKDGDAADVQYGNVVKISGCEFYNIGGNCVSSQERLIIVENCRGLGTGFSVSENRSVDGATSPTSVIQNYATKMVVSDSYFEDCSIGLDLGLGAVEMNNVYFGFTNTTAITNMWVAGGTLKLNNCTLTSASAFSAGYLIAVHTNRALTINGGHYNGKRQIYANQPASGGIALRNAIFGKDILNNDHAVTLNGATNSVIENCDFYGTGFRGVNLGTAIPSHNVLVRGGYFNAMSVYCDTSASTNLTVDGVYIYSLSSTIGFWSGSGHQLLNSTVIGNSTEINAVALVQNNTLSSLKFSTGGGGSYIGNTLYNTTIDGTVAQINTKLWRDNRDSSHLPLRNTTITANYTNDAIDSIVRFNGSLLTNTIPSAVTLNKGHEFTIKNLHSTALEITNATGAQTFDGALRLSVPQYGVVRLRSDGANWNIIDIYP